MTELTLISHYLCPYVQRAAILLQEKNVDFQRVYIDLSNKPDWFKALSPLGKVPLLQIESDGKKSTLFESAVILEYLEETQPKPLHPADPLERARHRAWMEFGSQILNKIAGFYSAQDEDALTARAQDMHVMFARLEDELKEGPYFSGPDFSLVDTVFGPVFRYFDVFDTIADFGVFEGLAKVQSWRAALSQRESVCGAVTDDYADRLMTFLVNKSSAISGKIAA